MAVSDLAFKHFISKYKEEYCVQLLDHCASGRSIESFCAVINSIPEALAYWANKYPEFEVCLRVAYWKSYYFWESQVIEDQNHISEMKTLSPKLFDSIMRNRFKWTDSANDLMMAIGRMTDAELEQRARRIIEARSPSEMLPADIQIEKALTIKEGKNGKKKD